ncbi:hypothetical protein STCU_10302 [Strigomonas culicis]|uniref:Transmembrane protein n=1 Tax=Strigomonas culicis TaxID=28005 RepID=S9TIN1_9TRYP|nr:hypothetical protein STCU_10302 [Strigomonas culicis]|eukprot:EPY17942.1 hypothetical protein STCU_10302 [Strigomonas culicis]
MNTSTPINYLLDDHRKGMATPRAERGPHCCRSRPVYKTSQWHFLSSLSFFFCLSFFPFSFVSVCLSILIFIVCMATSAVSSVFFFFLVSLFSFLKLK